MLRGPTRVDFPGKPQEGLLRKVLGGFVIARGATEKAQEFCVVVLEGKGDCSTSVDCDW